MILLYIKFKNEHVQRPREPRLHYLKQFCVVNKGIKKDHSHLYQHSRLPFGSSLVLMCYSTSKNKYWSASDLSIAVPFYETLSIQVCLISEKLLIKGLN